MSEVLCTRRPGAVDTLQARHRMHPRIADRAVPASFIAERRHSDLRELAVRSDGPGSFGARSSTQEYAMTNPWLKKNPFMSMWLSGAHSVANSARGQIAAEARRQSTTAINTAARDVFAVWADAMTGASAAKRKKRR